MSARSFILTIATAALSVLHGPAHAQVLEEVIVTATKREASLQDVPISVSAISGDLVREGAITQMSDVAVQTPNFSMAQFNIGEPQYFIRGVGSTLDSAGGDPAVATFIDEVYVGRSGGGSTDLFDLARIEILRGPQGTLFGKNVVGGAISIHTSRPSREFEGKVGATVGDYDLWALQAMVNGPLGDSTAGKLVLQKRERDGYTKNVLDGRKYQDEDNFSARGQLQFDPTGDLSILLGADYTDDDQAGNCRNVNNLDLSDPTGLAFVYPPVIAATTGGDIRKCASPVKAYQKRKIKGGLLRVDWDADRFTLTSLTAYREMDYDHLEDLAGMPQGETPFNLIDTVQEDSDQTSQELRLSSSGNEHLNWLAGAFYMQENIDRHEQFVGNFGPPLVPGPSALLDGDIAYVQDAETTSYAVFGQIDYAFNEAWSITLGSRYSYDKKEITQGIINYEDPAFDTAVLAAALGVPPEVVQAVFAPNEAVVLGIPVNGPGDLGAFVATGDVNALNFPYSVDADDDWDEVTSSASINWNYSDNGMIYLSWAEGYKSGAYGSQVPRPQAAVTPLEPENATSYELGLKSEFWDNRIRVNASVFSMDYQDLQVFRLVGSLLVAGNAEATSEGLELDVTALLTERWTVNANYAYLDATYDEYTDGAVDFSGNDMSRAPEDSFFLRSSYVVPFPGGSELDFVFSYAYTGDFYFEASNAAASKEDGYGLIDASLNWTSADAAWDVTLWGKNLDDEKYRVHTIISNIAGTVDVWGPPRTYGLTVNYSF